jgi:hypothetical protein
MPARRKMNVGQGLLLPQPRDKASRLLRMAA